MKKNLLALGSLSLAVLALASCSTSDPIKTVKINKGTSSYTMVDGPTRTAKSATSDLDVYINYEGTSGVSYRGTSWYNSVENKVYTQGTILPTWKELGALAGVNVVEACGYKATTNDSAFTAVATAGYKSETDSSRAIDLFYNSISNLKTAGNSGALVDLMPLINEGKLPNLKNLIDTNPEVAAIVEQMKVNGHLYYTPYVDGSNDVRKAFVLDTTMVKNVLGTGAGSSENVTQKAVYQAFITDESYDIKVSVAGVATDKSVPTWSTTVGTTVCKNIIEAQNALISAGCTGAQLKSQLVDYITERYATFGYTDLADLYVSESAAYTVDELVALMRVIHANPELATGKSGAKVQVFIPRGESSDAIESVYDLAQLWGVQGVDSANGNYYFDANGDLKSLETTQASYDALKYISQLYDEGLILQDFYKSTAQSSGTRYLDDYFKNQNDTYGFMMYDDVSIATSGNIEVDGIGVSNSTNQGYSPVLAPVTKWNTGETATLTRYYESSRSLQTTSWAIPTTSDNVDGALAMIDTMYTAYGQLVQNYGPSQYWVDGKVTEELVTGEQNAILSVKTKIELADSQTDYWSFMRGYLGAGHGVGHIRLNGANLQAVNSYAQAGLKNIQSAIANGVLVNSKVTTEYTWNSSVPVMFKTYVAEDDNAWDGVTGFWQANKINKNEGWVNVVIQDATTPTSEYIIKTAKNGLPITYDKMVAQWAARDQKCLATYAADLKN